MSKPLVLLCVAGAFASGCVAYDPQYDSSAYNTSQPRYSNYPASYPATQTRYYNSDGTYYYRDSDRDGVPNSQDRRPYDSNRY